MNFDRPWLLPMMVVGTVLFVALYRYSEARAHERALRYSNLAFLIAAAVPRRWPSILAAVAWTVAVACVLFALTGPHVRAQVPVRGGAVVLCIDTSGSMQAADVQPTRASAALRAMRTFIDNTPAATAIGLLSFSGQAQEIVAPTRDRTALQGALQGIPAPNGATAIGDALALSVRMLPRTGHRIVVLITDGENNAGSDPGAQAHILAARGVKLYTVGIGTDSGALIPGTLQTAGLNEPALRSYAQITGGAFSRADNAAELQTALRRLSRTTAYAPGSIDVSLGAAAAGACIMAVGFLWMKLI